MENLFWTGYSNDERMVAIRAIESIVNTYGFIIDFKQFSDISISITIEVAEANIDILYAELKKHLKLDDFEAIHASSDTERTVYLNVTFAKGSGDLKIEIPAVPG